MERDSEKALSTFFKPIAKNSLRVIIAMTLLTGFANGSEYSESFVVDFSPEKIKVLSPKTKKEVVSVVVYNKTLSPMYLKLSNESKDLSFFSIQTKKHKVVKIKTKDFKTLNLVPLSPPNQEVSLMFGKKAYDIPESK